VQCRRRRLITLALEVLVTDVVISFFDCQLRAVSARSTV
jgi:hypothetical protein